MRVQISNVMRYRYAKAVSFSPQTVRLFPRTDQAIVTHQLQTTVNLAADVQYRRDLFDNLIAKCVVQDAGSLLEIAVQLELEIRPRNPFHFLLAAHAVEFPFQYADHEEQVLGPFRAVRPEDDANMDFIWSLEGKCGTVDMLLDVVRTLHREIAYEVRLQGQARPPKEVLELRSGACRDIALLCAVLLRKLGLAVRLVSGFFCEFEIEVADRRAERGLHAWIEVYLPGAGWVGLDPTNGIFCDERFIPTAVGANMVDVAAIEGSYYGKERVECAFDAQLDIRLVTEPSLTKLAHRVEAILAGAGLQLTMGGEPTFIPQNAEGPEWSYAAVGPEKLDYAYRFANAIAEGVWPESMVLYTPGKLYPGEVDPRWAINVIRMDRPVAALPESGSAEVSSELRSDEIERFRQKIGEALGVHEPWLPALDPQAEAGHGPHAWVLPLDHTGDAWIGENWGVPTLTLTPAEGPAGLRLPFNELPATIRKRALVVEPQGGTLAVFLPPLLPGPFSDLVQIIARVAPAKICWHGYMPPDLPDSWSVIAFAADPGVLEVNVPPCPTWFEYRQWLERLQGIALELGLTTTRPGSVPSGTGGGNHLLFGGPSLDANPFFTRPTWLASMLRYWQHHPALAYLFTGNYVGPSSQAPRPDESGKLILDLELAYRQLENLESGDRRQEMHELVRHLHTDLGGNTHRSETSFDKFWQFPSGTRGLLEFRALESLPHPEWSSAVALLWRALFCYLHDRPFRAPLEDWGYRLHDQYLLPSFLWQDLTRILSDLAQFGIAFDPHIFREIWRWRFPVLLELDSVLNVRRALEAWPLLAEVPTSGGNTSRFVDASMERWEAVAETDWVGQHALYVNQREMTFRRLDSREMIAGFRFRKSAFYPSLHMRLAVQLPLEVAVVSREGQRVVRAWRYDGSAVQPVPPEEASVQPGPPADAASPGAYTYDLRVEEPLFG